MKKLICLALCAAFASCASIAPPASTGSVDHVVLVWLKRPGNPQDREKLISAGRELRSIPGIRALDHGTALASDRPVVDDSFDLGFVMRFDSPEALAAYESHPIHQRKVKDVLAPLSRKIVVYDITR
jgi:hypothetical protein